MKKESKSAQARPGRVTRKGTIPGTPAKMKVILHEGVATPIRTGKGKPAAYFNQETGEWVR